MPPKQERGLLKRKSGANGSPSKKPKHSNGKVTANQQPEGKAALQQRPPPARPVSAKREKQREKKIGLQEATSKWEKLRRHDTSEEERAELVALVLSQVKGRVGDVATSPTGSRVLQACAKHGTPAERASLLASVMPRMVELSKSPYGHFLVTKLISSAPQKQLESILKAVKGHVATLLRHPAGAAVIDEIYHRASAQQRNSLAAEFYGKEYALLSQVAPPRLGELLATVDGPKRRTIMQRMAVHLIPILEKGLVDPVLVHRLVAEYVEAAAPGACADALQALAGDALLRMVHTRDGAWLAAALLCYGTAKDCKKAVKAMKGHVETMAKDAWGSLVLCAALSHVDDTVLLSKVILPPLLANLEELTQDKHARLIFLQLLAPDRPRYLPAHLLGVVNPTISGPDAQPAPSVPEAVKERPGNGEDEEEASRVETRSAGAAGVRKKASDVRRTELLGEGPNSLAGSLLTLCTSKTADMLCSPTGSDIVVELATGSSTGVVQEHDAQAVEELQRAITAEVQKPLETGKHVAKTVFGSRALRRLVLASGAEDDQNDAPVRMRDSLWIAFKDRLKQCEGSHAQKVVEAFRARGLMTG